MTKKFDAETLKKLRSEPQPEPKQPDNGTASPSPERVREAVREANDPRRLVSISPGYHCSR